jgi:hypothetical protein
MMFYPWIVRILKRALPLAGNIEAYQFIFENFIVMTNDQPVPLVIERTLWHETPTERVIVRQTDLLQREEPLVILGEAGMGKSRLLEWMATSPNYAFCTARQFINRFNPRTLLGDAAYLVIDALDEISAAKDGNAVDLILRRLGELDYPRFVLSCRVSDWRSATGTEAIREQYAVRPTELFLEPLTKTDAQAVLTAALGHELATSVVQHFSAPGLEGLLGNPQTLELIARTAASGIFPHTRGELFRRSTELLRIEHRDSKAATQLDEITAINASGAAFASLILTGSEALSRKSAAHIADGDITVLEVAQLPGGAPVEAVLNTRLFRAYGPDRFSYLHRRIGEFLGAQWLAKLADTPRKRRRLLALFHSHTLVPASLRGIHAWLAQDQALAQSVIALDPLGVIEYGDADALPELHARWLLSALRKLAEGNPHFYDWGPLSAQGLFQPGLIDDIRQIIASPDAPFNLRLFLTKNIKGTLAASTLATDLRNLVLNPTTIFAIRRAAGEATSASIFGLDEWRNIIRLLLDLGDTLSIRLAIELLGDIGFDAADDAVISRLAVNYAMADQRTLGVLYSVERDLPLHRLEGILTHFVAAVGEIGSLENRPADNALTDFAYNLIGRRLAAGDVSAESLWTWLEPFDATVGYQRKPRLQVYDFICNHDDLRRAVQRQRILGAGGTENIGQRYYRMCRSSQGFNLTSEDAIELLGLLDPSNLADERWRDIVQLVRHDKSNGADVRLAARRFAERRPDMVSWLELLADPPQPQWQAEQAERERGARVRHAAKRSELQCHYLRHLQQIRIGDFQWVIKPAMVYLRLFSDCPSAPPHERIKEWLGGEVAAAAHEGFGAFLLAQPPQPPTAHDIAESIAKGERWNSGYIIVAALAERVRDGRGLQGLQDERVMAGFFMLHGTEVAQQAGLESLGALIELELSRRGKLQNAMRLYIEPQLREKRNHINGIHSLMCDDVYADMGADLAFRWMTQFDDLPAGIEEEMIGRLFRSGRDSDLRNFLIKREHVQDGDRRRNWRAAGLIVDFERMSHKLASTEIEAGLLWNLRDLMSRNGRSRTLSSIELDPVQIKWIVATFRPLWPLTPPPAVGWSGTQNAWDASEFLMQLLYRLGGNPSERAAASLRGLLEGPPDTYTDSIRSVAAEQAMARVEARFEPPSLGAIKAIACDLPPETALDLLGIVLEELSTVQDKIKSDDAESWRGFFDDKGVPYNEERCRDHLLGLLRQGSRAVEFNPETHVANDKEVDISCSVGPVRIPIEIKGQWHPQLWHGADTQLDLLYADDWRADRLGIYLVLWFGDQTEVNKKLVSPGRGKERPKTPCGLRDMLTAISKAAQEGRVKTFVLDLSRNATPPT